MTKIMSPEEEADWRQLAEDVRRWLVESENSSLYCAELARRYRQRHLIAKILVAAASCAPFIAKITVEAPETSSWFLAVIPLVAIAMPFWNPDKIVEASATAHGKFSSLTETLERLWTRIRVPPLADVAGLLKAYHVEVDRVSAMRGTARSAAALLPNDAALAKRCTTKTLDHFPFGALPGNVTTSPGPPSVAPGTPRAEFPPLLHENKQSPDINTGSVASGFPDIIKGGKGGGL